MKAIYEPRGADREYSPLAVNLYRGCTHGCVYCYAPDCTHTDRAAFHARSELREGVLDALALDCCKLRGSTDPVLMCFTSDPYQPGNSAPTRRALECFAAYDVPVSVLTKGGTRACRDFDLLRACRAAFGSTLVMISDDLREQWEPGAAAIENRLDAMGEAHALGIRTWLSLEPIIDPAEALEVILRTGEVVDEIKIGRLNHHPAAERVDWATWAPRLLAALEAASCDYLVKDSLRHYLPRDARLCRGGWQLSPTQSALF